MKTTQLLRLISIINSLFIIPACSAQNPSENLMEEVLEDLSVNNDINNSVNSLNWENELEELSNRLQEPVNLNSATREQAFIGLYLYTWANGNHLRTSVGRGTG